MQMPLSTVRAKICQDNTGASVELRILVTDRGPIQPLLRYQLQYWWKSLTWHEDLLQYTRLLIQYAVANVHSFKNERDLFQGFGARLYSGTIGQDGMDPSGLYWKPFSYYEAGVAIRMLTEFSKWHSKEYKTKPLNPLCKATTCEEILHWAAWKHRNDENFLADDDFDGDVLLPQGYERLFPKAASTQLHYN